ncbi:scamp family-domain-containing protein, partial [Catenaria anguillulae PL171]
MNPFLSPGERISPPVNPWSMSGASTSSAAATVLQTDIETPKESAAEALLKFREKDIERREAALAQREQAIRAREEKVEEVMGRQFNWPWFKPILFHDINKEIPSGGRPVVRRMYGVWMFAVWTYFMNCIACLSMLATQHPAGGSMFGMSLLTIVQALGVMQLYDGARDDKSIRFFLFFLNFAFHLGATVVLGIGIPGWGGAGVIVTLDQFGRNLGSGIVCIVSSVSFGVQLLIGVWGLKEVTYYYRSMGHSVKKAQQEAVSAGMRSEAGQALVKEGAKQVVAAKVGQIKKGDGSM